MALKRTLPTSCFSKEDAEAARYQLEDTLCRQRWIVSTSRVIQRVRHASTTGGHYAPVGKQAS